MTATPEDLTGRLEGGVRAFIRAAHLGRVALGGIGMIVALDADGRPTGNRWIDTGLTIGAMLWVCSLALLSSRLDTILRRRPRLIWIDTVVVLGLIAVDKPWDSLAALPYAALAFLVPYVRPAGLLAATAVAVVTGYVPKLVALVAAPADAGHIAPTTTADLLTAYIGPMIGGVFAWGACTLLHQVRQATARYEDAQQALTVAEERRAEIDARHALADQLHDTISQSIRAIPLRLDGPPPTGLSPLLLRTRSEIIATANSARPASRVLAKRLRG